VLSRDKESREQALAKLLGAGRQWGKQNQILLENIIAVEEAGLKDAARYLVELDKKIYFWNWKIKKKISAVLKKWAY